MNNLSPEYRIVLNEQLLKYPLFIEFLKREFRRLLVERLMLLNVDLTLVYKFTVTYIPVQWGNYIIPKIKMMENGIIPRNDKLERIAEILKELDPLDPHPVDLEFTLQQIVLFVEKNVKRFQGVQLGEAIEYFGIEEALWFDEYPIATGTVIRAVDYGTLDNPPLNLFNSVFNEMRATILDLFAKFIEQGMPKKEQKVVNTENPENSDQVGELVRVGDSSDSNTSSEASSGEINNADV